MGSEWVNERAILRDLAQVQGRVPAALAGTLAAGDKPEDPRIIEDTEEEYYRDGVCEGELQQPDFSLITHLLDQVHIKEKEAQEDATPATSEDDTTSEELYASSENATSEQFATPEENGSRKQAASLKNKTITKQRKERNVAVKSLLEMHKNTSENNYLDLKATMESRIGIHKSSETAKSDDSLLSIGNNKNVCRETKIIKRQPSLDLNPSTMFVRRRF